MNSDLYYLFAVSVLPISALFIAAVLIVVARRDDRRSHQTPAE